MRLTRYLAICLLMLLASMKVAMAQQTTGQFVIKTTYDAQVHYLSHASNTLGDATVFTPSCLWTSDNTHTQAGANKNYYFYDGVNYRFLGAPNFEAGGALTLSASLPLANQLSTPESQYYFYKWDSGLGRGVQYYGVTQDYCTNTLHYGWDNQSNECWEVYWVAFDETTTAWKMSEMSYDITANSGKFYPVTITLHDEETTVTAGGLSSLTDFEMEYQDEYQVTPIVVDYQYTVRPAYATYYFDNATHNYWGDADHGETIPDAVSHGPVAVSSYAWSITGDGASYLTISDASAPSPTITYSTANNSGHTTATLTLTVTYSDGSTQTTSTTIFVKTPCQNPTVSDEVDVTYIGATVSWTHTAENYIVSWKKSSESTWTSHEVGNVSSYTITGLEYGNETYQFKVKASSCTTNEPTEPYKTFTTLSEPGLVVGGAIFGGGRMANVTGKTEVVVVNCDFINAIYGGNDIAGEVEGRDGSTITLGVNSDDATYSTYGVTDGDFVVGSVYGGGNGYYAYNGNSFVAATSDYSSQSVAVGGHVNAMTQLHSLGDVVWTNNGTTAKTLDFPSIVKSSIRVSNNYVKVDSIFGGAKNAFLTHIEGYDDQDKAITATNGSTITIDGGTILAVFGGNNFGGGQGYGKHYIEVNGTTTNLVPSIVNGDNSGYGRDFGIRYLYGGGNKVAGSTTDVHIKGGQVDELFAGGNAADIYYANVTVECSLGTDAGDHIAFGNTYTNAINHSNYSTSGTPEEGTIGANTVKSEYAWDGLSGIYNVRTLYGGNNKAEMQRVPTITLTSGSVGTVYGGGNAGDMMGAASTTDIITVSVQYGTHVVLNSDKILVDYIYGGCRMSNVLNSTWVELKKGHVGTVYGGCNISGDVGSTRFYDPYPSGLTYPADLEEQRVKGATYVRAGEGSGDNSNLIVYKDLFAGSNGYYHCSSDGIHYNEDTKFGFPQELYAGITIPTHNETNVKVSAGATVKGNVYAGGNLAPVGFDDNTGFIRGFPELVGMATVLMDGGIVEQNVYGGGKMASIFGENEVKVSGGTITKALYGGNDIAGQVAEKTNRKLPAGYGYTLASDGYTSLTDLGVRTFVGVSGNARIGTVYGGGNGDYIYGDGEGEKPYCGATPSHPIQPHTFVDIHINGGSEGGKINAVYGGGNGVTIRDGATVFVNIVETAGDYDNIDTIFGGNNKGDLVVVPDIRLVHGQVKYVYGGCNRGAMMANLPQTLKTIGGYNNIGSYVRLMNEYVVVTDNSTEPPTTHTETVTAKVSGAIFGGCRMNGVTNNSLVLVEGGNFLNTPIYGGSDISGNVGGWSRVAVTGGSTGHIYGGGNGGYKYYDNNVYTTSDELIAEGTSEHPIIAPNCAYSGVDILGGQVGSSGNNREAFGGGYGADTKTTGDVEVNIGPATASDWTGLPVIYGDIYGGSALGSVNTNNVNTNNENHTQVNFLNGTLHGNLFGGGLGDAGDANKGKTYGKVFVTVGNSSPAEDNCFIDLRDASIYGCNNTNGSPQDDVTVNIYRTAHTTTDEAGYTTGSGAPTFAIDNVFGGGKSANYAPAESPNKATVHVFGCENTIRRVFGGGDAAAASKVATIIEGGRMDQVFGGGNGETTPADIGAGGIELNVSGGKIRQLFGGNNTSGQIAGPMTINVTNSGSCAEDITEFFGGSNAAPMGTADDPVTLTTTIGCNTVNPVAIANVYGGSSLAPIIGNVTLTIEGGTFTEVYAGSKGAVGTPANITGNTTLNLYGGTITDAFGGNNVNGNITGSITVNVLDHQQCTLNVHNIYGASNATAYTPTDPSSSSPVINLMHVSQDAGITGNIYGGGNQGAVVANPVVNIGYDASSMLTLIPEGYPIAEADRRAFVSGKVFGGGNEAGVTGGTTINMRSGTVLTGIYGGCNTNGTVTANTMVSFTGGNVGDASTLTCGAIYGGGLGEATKVKGDVEVTINGATAHIYGDVYGGSAKGLVNCNDDGTAATEGSTTTVTLTDGIVDGAIYGGGHGLEGANAHVWGPVRVTVNGGDVDNVFGCNNLNGQPMSTVLVDINGASAVVGDVYGGGNEAYYDKTPRVRIQNGTISGKVFGGGNSITTANKGVTGGDVTMTGGTVLGGIYGGCNVDGDVTGPVMVTITGGTVGSESQKGYIHGGGYGANTTVTGNVKVTFGDINTAQSEYPWLYGELYGGSAMGSVNTSSTDKTTVDIMNGTIVGSVFGGGLGYNDHAAVVNGTVQVNIGYYSGNIANATLIGNATLNECDVYGCNNLNGTPKGDVYVDIFNCYRRPQDEVDYSAVDLGYSIRNVFGGGNRAHYEPLGSNRTHVYVWGCDNTVQFMYAGGNAADAYGVQIVVEGGRFREAYAGGNGLLVAANIGEGSTQFNFHGRYYFTYEGSNRQGNIGGTPNQPIPSFKEGRSDCSETFIESHYFGANKAEMYVDVLESVISCADAAEVNYTNLYAGSRFAIIYGDVKLTVEGGTIMNLFGGSQGYEEYSSDIRHYPTYEEIVADRALSEDKRKYSNDLLEYMGYLTKVNDEYVVNEGYTADHQHESAGKGGNVTLVVTGGTIGSIIGGCDINGKVEGKITVIIDENSGCDLRVGNIYGGCNKAFYEPSVAEGIMTPKVEVLKGTIGIPEGYDFNGNGTIEASERYVGNVYGGGNFGNVKSNPLVIIGDGTIGDGATKVTVKGDVYGGGNEGDVEGSPQVVIVPSPTHSLTSQTPSNGTIQITHSAPSIGEGVEVDIKAIPDECYVFDAWNVVSGEDESIDNSKRESTTFKMGSGDAEISASFRVASQYPFTYSSDGNGTVSVKNSDNTAVSSGNYVCERQVLDIEATPSSSYAFDHWEVVSGTGASVKRSQWRTTTFTMGLEASQLRAYFVNTYNLTVSATNGNVVVTDIMDSTLSGSPMSIGAGAVLDLRAVPNKGYRFVRWEVTGAGSSVIATTTASTAFTMGTEAATVTAVFEPIRYTLTINVSPDESGTVTVNGNSYTAPLEFAQGTVVNIVATPAEGKSFVGWSISGSGTIANNTEATTTFTVGNDDATITAEFQ